MSESRLRAFVDILFQKMFPNWKELLKRDLAGCESILDLGCGSNSFLQYCPAPYKVGVDLYEPYMVESKKKGIHHHYIKANILELEMPPKSFDAVVSLAVVEHLSKEDGIALIKKMIPIARKRVIFTVTNGYLFQDAFDGNPLQEHKSDWSVKEVKDLGFKVYGIFGWKPLRGYRGRFTYKPDFLWAIISGITQYVTYYCPRLAFLFYARKDL